ncbi:hypothetical protein [Snodgrassella alvi]|uniref:DUF680 domain-containing protein n=1 Tax=Snodgrassella alvi TaxID=1196083 RepID=A0A2N9WQX0_9NEIS|nr:hypothetical protein [Snodgrassella alvi]PIT12259.1 hypothetical protein BGI32_09775 [Snodgrassella alvi]PIT16477.1 hypothetical protein BGI33_03795 [Snodgrassella alvi]PIT18407.1 hypothetical protein BGI34_05295 [Snodgrassella alvi]
MRKLVSTALLAVSLTMTAGFALANSNNDTTDIRHFSEATAQNGQNTHISASTPENTPYRTVNTYAGNH